MGGPRQPARRPISPPHRYAQALFFLFLGFQLLLIKLLRPSPWWLLWYSLVGFGVGLGLSFLFYYNRKKKAESCEVVSSSLRALLHTKAGREGASSTLGVEAPRSRPRLALMWWWRCVRARARSWASMWASRGCTTWLAACPRGST